MSGVALHDVGKTYARGQRAVDRVSLDVREGELLVLVGPSGCGKSTLLRMIAGLEDVSEGEIRIGERVVNEVPPRDRDVAMVFQNYALYPHMTVFENMAFGLRLRLRGAAAADVERRVRETADALGLAPYLGRRPRELSGGERQRVALGRAMVRHPRLFLFDEPLSNLDARLRVQMRAEIKRLHQRVGATMIYVTHDQVEAMTLGDRIAVLRRGVLQQCADPDTLYARPANQFVAGFIGSPPINFFAAVVAPAGDALEAGGLTLPIGDAGRRVLAGRAGQPVTVGIRPEDLVLAGNGGRIPASVDVREPLGNETLVYWSSPVGTLTSRVPGRAAPAVGERAELHVAAERLHLFDAGTEAALDAG